MQVVRALQGKVTAHLDAWRSAGGLDRPRAGDDLQDLGQVSASRRIDIVVRTHRWNAVDWIGEGGGYLREGEETPNDSIFIFFARL